MSILATSSSSPNWATQLTAWATFALAVLAILTLAGAIYQLRRNRLSEREARAHHYLARWNAVEEIPYTAKTWGFVAQKKSDQTAKLADWQAMSYKAKLETTHVMNFWEELAGMYNRNLVDCALVRDYFGSGALQFWDTSKWFIMSLRGDTPRVMVELQLMCADIKRHRDQETAPTAGRVAPDRAVLPELIRRYRVRRREKTQADAAAIT